MNDMTDQPTMALALSDDQLIDVLISSIYPGAKRESAAMVLSYCRATNLDPMLKPVHIVPMSVKSGMKNRDGYDEYVSRDVVMPGIGLYRITAARTGEYAGQDEPRWGPMKEMTYTATKRDWVTVPGREKKQPRDTVFEKTLEYPEWCAVTVYRLVGGFRVAFTAVEYWTENYATASKNGDAPNAMWERRTRGQLAKCAEAQALRKGFPEVGSQPTAEEMEGRDYSDEAPEAPPIAEPAVRPRRASETAGATPPALTDETLAQQQAAALVPAATQATKEPVAVEPPAPTPTAAPAPVVAAPAPAPAPQPAATQPPAEPASEGERKNVLITAKAKKVDLAQLTQQLGIVGLSVETLDGLTKVQFKAIKGAL